MATDSIGGIIRRVLEIEARSISDLVARVDASTARAVEWLVACRGRVIVSGMGKMGCVARKFAATLASTGTPAIFVQASEALHGDLGIVTASDLVIALSNSGETEEIVALLPYLKRKSIPVIAMTGAPRSTLARASQVVIDVGVTAEADPECPAPTCSTTAALAMCDALAVAAMRQRGLTRDQFAIFHPGGQLGRKLLFKVAHLMTTGERIPLAAPHICLRDAIVAMSRGGLGALFIVDESRRLVGILTDGDLRRIFQAKPEPLQLRLDELMMRTPQTIGPDALAAEGLRVMEHKSITVLPVVDDAGVVIGALHLHDLLRAHLA
jgi:arabinose-5-phosphate isomerase